MWKEKICFPVSCCIFKRTGGKTGTIFLCINCQLLLSLLLHDCLTSCLFFFTGNLINNFFWSQAIIVKDWLSHRKCLVPRKTYSLKDQHWRQGIKGEISMMMFQDWDTRHFSRHAVPHVGSFFFTKRLFLCFRSSQMLTSDKQHKQHRQKETCFNWKFVQFVNH